MTAIIYYLSECIEFLLFNLVGIVIVSFILYYMSQNFKLKFITLYGFFSKLDFIALVMLTSCILKEIALLYCLFKISSFSMIYLYIFMSFCFIYAFFSFNIKEFIKEMIVSIIENLIIFSLNLLSMFINEIRYSKMISYYICILSLILISCSIFFFVKNLSFILLRNEYVRRNQVVR